MSRGFGIALLSIFGVIALFVAIGLILGDSSTAVETTAPQEPQAAAIVPPVAYTVINTSDSSAKALTRPLSSYSPQEIDKLPTDKKMIYRVVVEPGITRSQVKATMAQVVADVRAKDRDIDEIGIFMFDNKSLVTGAWNVASGIWAPGGKFGNVTPEIATTNLRQGYSITISYGSAVN